MEARFKVRRPHRHGPWEKVHRAVRIVKVRPGDEWEEELPEEGGMPGQVWVSGGDHEPRAKHVMPRRWGGPSGPGFGPGGRWGRRGGPHVGRGDVRAAILLSLAERPQHGYQLIQEISEWSGGLWRPSPGSVYPALQLLEDEGFVRIEEESGRRVYHLTEAGRAHVEAHRQALVAARDAVTGAMDEAVLTLRDLHEQVGAALMQVARAGTPGQVAAARDLLTGTRRQLYRILAGDDPAGEHDRP